VTRIVALTLLIVTAAAAPALAGQREVEERLACQCGCGLTVHTCNHLQCSFAVPVRQDIAKSLAAGQAEDEIVARYVAEYGEKVLSSPTHEGFNLLAWWGPYIAILVGAAALAIAIRRFRGKPQPITGEPVVPDPQSAALRAQLEKELERIDS
jgi:cytochrome c-type biogenesis protein CcmH